MYSIATRSAADRNDQIAGVRLFLDLIHGNDSNVSTINKRVAQVAIIEIDSSIDGWYSHPISVIANAGDHACHHATRMQNSWWKFARWIVGRCKTKYIRAAYGFGPKSRAERIAYYTTQARIRTTIRFDRRRMIVRLDFENHMIFVVELDDPSVVFEHTDTPIVRSQQFADLDRGSKNRFFQHALEMPCSVFVPILDLATQGFVTAMLAPCLSDGFQFDIGRVAALFAKLLLYGQHFCDRQIKLTGLAQLHERILIQVADRHNDELERIGRSDCNLLELQWTYIDLFDRVVCKHLLTEALDDCRVDGRVD